MKVLIVLLFIVSFSSCFLMTEDFDKEYYERISGINFPKQYTVLETYEGEFYTTTTFKVDKIQLSKFILDYKLDTLKKLYPSQFLGEHSLKKDIPILSDFSVLFYTDSSRGKNSWLYIVDMKKEILWAEIQFPDLAGD